MTPSKAILAGSATIAVAIVASAAVFLPQRTATIGDEGAQRYQIVKVEKDRTWRLDSETGRITLCRLDGDALICAESTEATRFPPMSPGDVAAAREAERQRQQEADDRRRQQKIAERNYIFDRFFALFDRILRFAEKHPDRSQPPANEPDET